MRVAAVKVPREEGSSLLRSSRRSPWQLSHSPPPGTCQYNTEEPVCGMNAYQRMWEGAILYSSESFVVHFLELNILSVIFVCLESFHTPEFLK